MADKLKPCPFCGSENLAVRHQFITCKKCGAEGPIYNERGEFFTFNGETDATWNKRQGENDENVHN